AWFGTQGLIGKRPYDGAIGDGIIDLLSPVHGYLLAHGAARDGLLIVSSACIDLLTVFLLARSIFGRSIRPFLVLLIIFALRQLFQSVCVLPRPDEMIWQCPGFPSLVVTYGVSNDLFFSGHTAMAVYGAAVLGRLGKGWAVAGLLIALFEM